MPVSFKIAIPATSIHATSFLEQWIREVLYADEYTGRQSSGNVSAAEQTYSHQLVRVMRLLLELAGIPVFDSLDILSLAAVPGTTRTLAMEMSLPDLGFVVQADYRRVIGFAANLCELMGRTPISDTTKESVFAEIERQVIMPSQGKLLFGKSSMHLLRGAHKLGIPFMHLGAGIYQFGRGSKARRMERSISDRDSAIGDRIVRSKAIAGALLRMAGLPAPVHVLLNDAAELPDAVRRLGYPLVVKPSDSGRGQGVSVDIVDEKMLVEAFDIALKHSVSAQVLVEKQVAGVCHRLFIANGKLLYAVKRLPMSVIGDGEHNVAALIDIERAKQLQLPPWRRSPAPALDEPARIAMQKAGWDGDSIPGAGIRVPLRRIESTESGGVDEDVTTTLHPENLAVALSAVKVSGLDIAGIDIISPDITVPWFNNGAIINEVNIGPLFGGGEISRSHIPAFFRDFMIGDGKIPIETYTGSDAWEIARQKQADYGKRGLRCFVASAGAMLASDGKPLVMPLAQLEDRVRALLYRNDVDAILIVSQ